MLKGIFFKKDFHTKILKKFIYFILQQSFKCLRSLNKQCGNFFVAK